MLLKEFFIGLAAYPKAVSLIRKHKLNAYLLLPGLLSILCFSLILASGFFFIGDLADWAKSNVISEIPIEELALLFQIVLWLFLAAMAFFSFKYIVLIILAPVLSHLSEVVEKKISGQEAPAFRITDFAKDILRALKINLRNLFIELGLTILLNIIPLIQFAAPLTVFLLQSYFGGFSLMDYVLERKKYSTSQTLKFVRRHRGLSLGIGAGFMVISLVPIVGWFLAPTYGTVAGTIATLEAVQRDPKV